MNTPRNDAAITFDDVGKRFGDAWVVEHLSLEVPSGAIVGLIGPSGSGKTTTVRLATGVYTPDHGTVHLLGSPPSDLRARDRTRLGYLPQTPVLFDDLTLRENLNFHSSLNGVKFQRRKWLDELMELVELDGHEKKLVREASGGMQRRLALAATLVHDPHVVLLDEPTAGIDPILRARLWERFRALADEGRTLVVTTQYIGEAANCERVGLLAEGRLIAFGSPDELRRDASGGELLEVTFDRAVSASLAQDLAQGCEARSHTQLAANRVRFVVDDGGKALAILTQALEAYDLTVEDTEEVIMSYDDMFVALVERATGTHGPAEVAT